MPSFLYFQSITNYKMCMPATCNTCDKTTWKGCGLHVPYAMDSIPKSQWCTCKSADGSLSEYPPKLGTGIAG
ncbi:hypothetical protein DASC09_016300 [Saccharomycopsis crataegensis]|uniref:Uncharacterized protein n=1 Tax=Saccharomycopsis crataegensis TaxID=43959 RepID=A0AAV5QIJ3_9ASCO|nr:hypothetical protein DASC09_016300 [Saccharomycopsis crataegensis]